MLEVGVQDEQRGGGRGRRRRPQPARGAELRLHRVPVHVPRVPAVPAVPARGPRRPPPRRRASPAAPRRPRPRRPAAGAAPRRLELRHGSFVLLENLVEYGVHPQVSLLAPAGRRVARRVGAVAVVVGGGAL